MSNQDAIESAVERIQSLMAYSRETGARTGYVQGKILRDFSASEQEQIIRLVSSPLAGGSIEAATASDYFHDVDYFGIQIPPNHLNQQ